MRAKLNQRTVAALEPSKTPYDIRDTAITGFSGGDVTPEGKEVLSLDLLNRRRTCVNTKSSGLESKLSVIDRTMGLQTCARK